MTNENERTYTQKEVLLIIEKDRIRVMEECGKDSLWYDSKTIDEFPPDLSLDETKNTL